MGKEIILNKEYLEAMSNSFEAVFEKADIAGQNAEHAERTADSGVLYKSLVKQMDNIRSSIRLILDSFSSTDQNMKEEAQKIVGEDIYYGIASGGRAIINEDGSYVVEEGYLERLKSYKGIIQPQGSDECTNMSTAAIIQRYRLVNDSSYNNEYGYREGPIDIHPYVEGWNTVMSASLPDGHTYKTNGNYQGSMTQDYLANLVSEHPEGVVLYAHYADCHGVGSGAHGIVITRYERNVDGSYKFYAIDSVSNRDGGCERELTSTYLYDGGASLYPGSRYNHASYNSVDDLLNNMIAYQYISEFN